MELFSGTADAFILIVLMIGFVIVFVSVLSVVLEFLFVAFDSLLGVWITIDNVLHILVVFDILYIITFPGVVFHEFSHYLTCRLLGIRIKEVKFFKLGHVLGYVKHDEVKSFAKNFLIIIAPFFGNSLVSILCFSIILFLKPEFWISVFFFWLGMSSAMHAAPSNPDAQILWYQTKVEIKRKNYFAAIGYPVSWIILISNSLGGYLWDIVYGFILLIAVGIAKFLI